MLTDERKFVFVFWIEIETPFRLDVLLFPTSGDDWFNVIEKASTKLVGQTKFRQRGLGPLE